MCEKVAAKFCTKEEEEGRRAKSQKIEYPPQHEISSDLLCKWLNRAVNMYRRDWELQRRKNARQKEMKKDARAAAQKEKAVKLEEEARRSSIPGRGGRFKNEEGYWRSRRHVKPGQEMPSESGRGTAETIMSGANAGVLQQPSSSLM